MDFNGTLFPYLNQPGISTSSFAKIRLNGTLFPYSIRLSLAEDRYYVTVLTGYDFLTHFDVQPAHQEVIKFKS